MSGPLPSVLKDNPFAREMYERMREVQSRETGRVTGNPTEKPKPKPKTDPWVGIKGLEEAKRLLQEAIEKPYTHKKFYDFYNKVPPAGILLYGPPGCGKTLLGEAASASIHGDIEDDDSFIYISGPQLMDKYVGETERKIREVFGRARAFGKKYDRRAILFLDEADSLLMQRGTGPWYLDSQVNQFLTEMDGMNENREFNPIVILATNRHNRLDTAVLREGRVDYKICVPRPGREAVADIILHNLGNVPICKTVKKDEMITSTVEALYSDDLLIKKFKVEGERVRFLFKDILNGALVAQVVEHAKSVALRRDIASGKTTGLRTADMLESVKTIFSQNVAMNQDENLAMFLEANGYDIN